MAIHYSILDFYAKDYYINLYLTFMQKTTNKDWWYTDVLRNDQLNRNYIMKLVSASVIQDNSRFWAYEKYNNGYRFSCPWIVP